MSKKKKPSSPNNTVQADLGMYSFNNIEINKDAIEPHEYFKVLKANRKETVIEDLNKQLVAIAANILKAKSIGQKSLLEKLSFTYETILKEQELFAHGYKSFVYEKDVKAFIDKTKNIKIIELSRYPRVIPDENLAEIKRVQDLNIIQDYLVVFTDYSDNDYKTPAEKEEVKRNRDPVVFGHFRHKDTGIKHDRLYLITDWEDEDCDLNFSELVSRMKVSGIEAAHEVSQNVEYLNEIVRSTLDDMSRPKSNNFSFKTEPPKKSFWEKLKFWKK